jgi:hypothetical protein
MSKVSNSIQWIVMRLIVAIILAAIIICSVYFYKKIDKEKFTIKHDSTNGDIIILKEEIKRFIDVALMINPPVKTNIRSYFSNGLIAKPGFKAEIKSFTRGYTLNALKDFLKSRYSTFLEALCKNVSPMNPRQDADYNNMIRDLFRKQIDSMVMFYNEILTALDSKTITIEYKKEKVVRLENQIKCILKSANFMSQATRNENYYTDLANKFYELIFKILDEANYDYCVNVNMTPPYILSSTYINTRNKIKECKVDPDPDKDARPDDYPLQDEDALYMPYDNKSPTVWTSRGQTENQPSRADAPETGSGFGSLLSSTSNSQMSGTPATSNTSNTSATSTSSDSSNSNWADNYKKLFWRVSIICKQ